GAPRGGRASGEQPEGHPVRNVPRLHVRHPRVRLRSVTWESDRCVDGPSEVACANVGRLTPPHVERHPPLLAAVPIGLLTIGWSERPARAACNTIPAPSNAFRSQAGTVDRPFAGPGDFVTLGLDPVCDGSRAFAADPSGNVVTIVFTPPGGGPRNVVVL